MSNVFLAREQFGLVGGAVVIKVALGGGNATVCHTNGFNLACRGDGRDALLQLGTAALGADRRATRSNQGLERVAAGLAVVVENGHGGLDRKSTRLNSS